MDKNLKEKLNNGDIVKLRNGKYFVFNGKRFWSGDCYISLDDYDEKLRFNNLRNRALDIVKVKRPRSEEIEKFGAKVETTVWEEKTPNMWGDMTYPEAHKKMFMAIANGEVATKMEWLKKTNPDFDPYYYELENNCFACTEAIRREAEVETQDTRIAFSMLAYHSFSDTYCKYCPLGGIGDSKMCLNGLYDKFFNAKGFEKFKLAYEIANLEWKEEE